jgi:type IV pilus assembly protein PilE
MKEVGMKAHSLSRPPHTTGFTLVELMVVVAIATILLSIAVPSYMAQVRESRRTDARTALLDLAGREESYNSTMNAYTNTATNLGYPNPPGFPATVGSGYYTITVACFAASGAALACDASPTAPVGPAYYLTATPIGSQVKDTQCLTLSVDSLGNRFSTGSGTNLQCWGSQ